MTRHRVNSVRDFGQRILQSSSAASLVTAHAEKEIQDVTKLQALVRGYLIRNNPAIAKDADVKEEKLGMLLDLSTDSRDAKRPLSQIDKATQVLSSTTKNDSELRSGSVVKDDLPAEAPIVASDEAVHTDCLQEAATKIQATACGYTARGRASVLEPSVQAERTEESAKDDGTETAREEDTKMDEKKPVPAAGSAGQPKSANTESATESTAPVIESSSKLIGHAETPVEYLLTEKPAVEEAPKVEYKMPGDNKDTAGADTVADAKSMTRAYEQGSTESEIETPSNIFFGWIPCGM
jgi:hypothetical protein